jgi:hypothetical protein
MPPGLGLPLVPGLRCWSEEAVRELCSVFGRFPDDEDGCGVFWSILHGIESLPSYEEQLMECVSSRLSWFGILMLGRQLNGGIREIGGVSLRDFLQGVASNDLVSTGIRRLASGFATRDFNKPVE